MADGALPETFATDGGPLCWLSVGATIYLGPPLDISAHARMVGALTVGVSGQLTITTAGGPPVRARSAFIPARTVTEMVSAPNIVAVCTFDPTAARVARCTAGMVRAADGLLTGHRNEDRLIEAFTADALCPRQILQHLGLAAVPSASTRPVDPRIALVGTMIGRDPLTTLNAAEAAAAVRLSRAYFLTLFSHETGTTFRRYRLWVRLIHAATSVAAGVPLTRAATDAGFASASHLSDTVRAVLGISATAALDTGVRLLVDHRAQLSGTDETVAGRACAGDSSKVASRSPRDPARPAR